MLPRYLPDARSLLVGLHYSLAPLPREPMRPRRADPRIGLFTTTVLDFSSDLQDSPRQRWVNRWRLEKKDPAAEVSEAVKPITFWIDRNVPLAYRETVRAAVLEWNKPFEKIGYSNAIVVQQQPDDAAFDTLDFGYASVRWMMNADPVFGAIGPSHVDPRTGEILDADIAFEGMQTRKARQERTQMLGRSPPGADAVAPGFAAPFEFPGGNAAPYDHRLCQAGALAAEQLGYALDVLEASGEIEPDSPIAQQFVVDYVKQVVMHEVGHALGLRHNFRASRAYTEAQLSDPEFTRAHGTAASVMEYNAVNLPQPGRSGGLPFQTALGPYDYWAIEYAYKPMPPGADAETERAELQRIAARSSEPLLAYGTDEDNAFGIDPETIQLDLGSDPIAFASKRLEIARDLFRRQETRALSPQRDYAVLRRSLAYAIADVTRAVGTLVRQIGGVRTLRDFPGSGRDPLQPVDAGVQRQALDLIAGAVLAADGLELSPALQRRLAPDFLERVELSLPTDYAVPQRLLELQRAVLGYLMSDTIAARILDSVGKFDHPAEAFPLAELYARLSDEVWSELDRGQAILQPRRELQREHVNRLAAALLRPSPQARADARGLLRAQARALLPRIEAAQRRRAGADAQTLAHLADAADTLRMALAAPLLRQGL
ncbi:MAG: zinc-dependent metalloprotease [Rubrivivax sp.]|nr:zinc-dependent metalloprotease [Rubrivivax sp.]